MILHGPVDTIKTLDTYGISTVCCLVSAGAGGTQATQSIRALHTPLQDVTWGLGVKVSTQTWPT